MSDAVTIEEWAQGERLRLEDFIREWTGNNSLDPEHWPSKMPEGEWDEQFRTFDG